MTIIDNFIDKARGILFSDKPYQDKLNVFIQFLESKVEHTPELTMMKLTKPNSLLIS